jgi:GH35 family endo-1,4-beta-xylanase
MFHGHHAYSDLANEMVSAPFIQEQCGGEQILIDWYKRAHELDPAVKLTVNDYEQMRGRGTRVDDLVKRFKAAGATVAAQGEQFHDRGMWYPPSEVWGLLDRLAANHVEVHLTEITQPDDGATIQGGYVDGVVWNSGNQAAYLKQTYRLAFGHPAVAAIVMWNFWDGATWLPRGGIVEQNFQPKPAYQALQDLITHEWSTDLSLKASARGEASGRGFYGTYEITVTKPGGASETFQETLAQGQAKPGTVWRLQSKGP